MEHVRDNLEDIAERHTGGITPHELDKELEFRGIGREEFLDYVRLLEKRGERHLSAYYEPVAEQMGMYPERASRRR
jgi:hypothetical protein